MIYFCADDYGMSKESNDRIEECLQNGALNKISVLPNGEIANFTNRLNKTEVKLSLHLNLVEGHPLSDAKEISLLVDDNGCFKYSFTLLLFLSLLQKKEELRRQLFTEIQNQVKFWKEQLGENTGIFIDSHQHVHMIPLVFKTLLDVIKEEKLQVDSLRIPAEPITPYIKTPSLYLSYAPVGLVKQWLLKFLAFVNRKELEKSQIPYSYFMGVLFSGKMDKRKISKILPKYLKIAEKHSKDVELGFHPGYSEIGEKLFDGSRKSFSKFYFSPWRKVEFDTLLNDLKEG